MCLDPRNSMQLITASTDGYVRRWDYTDGTLLKKFNVGKPVIYMKMHPNKSNVAFITTQKLAKEATIPTDVLWKCTLPRNSEQCFMVRLAKTKLCRGIALSPKGDVVALAGQKALTIVTLNETDDDASIAKHKSPNPLTCVAFHPFEPYVATGDSWGQIRIWHCLSAEEQSKPTIEMMHWHAHEVGALQFTTDGAYLLSGGEEAVLVTWTLGTARKRFLPRLGAAITSITISSDERLYALGHTDNTIRLLNAVDNSVREAVAGFKTEVAMTPESSFPAGLTIEPRNGLMVTNGSNGALQFYHFEQDIHVADLEVAPINRVSRMNEEEIGSAQVDKVAFSDDGTVMATVDSRNDGDTTPEWHLKFWHYSADKQAYDLNTIMQASHESAITSLRLRPGHRQAVTTSPDKTFKLWNVKSRSDKTGSVEQYWTLQATGAFRKMVPSTACYSPDGSMLAIAFGSYLTFWDPDSMERRFVLDLADGFDSVQHLAFPNGPGAFLVVASQRRLLVWNLLTMKVEWKLQSNVQAIVCRPRTNEFAVMKTSQDGTVMEIYESDSSTPLLTMKTDSNVFGMVFRNHLTNTSDFIYLNSNLEICTLRAEEEIASDSTYSLKSTQITPDSSLFANLYGNVSSEYRPKAASSDRLIQYGASVSALKMFADVPSHVMPPIGMLWNDYMDSVMITAGEDKKSDQKHVDEDLEEEDDDADVMDMDEKPAKTARKKSSSVESQCLESSTFTNDVEFLAQVFAQLHSNGKTEATSTVKINGKVKTNGVKPPHPNGKNESSKSPKSPKTKNKSKNEKSPRAKAVKVGSKRVIDEMTE